MRKFIAEYIRIIAYAALGIAFSIASFYLIINIQHGKEVSTPIYLSESEPTYHNFQDKVNQIEQNLNKFSKVKNSNKNLQKMYSKLTTCLGVLKSQDGLAGLKLSNYYKPLDIYKLGANFQSKELNICWAVHLSYLTTDEAPKEFLQVAPYVSNTVNLVSASVSSSLSEIQNNSSYFFTTNITSSTIRNYLSADYATIAKAYDGFAGVILNLSELINDESLGGQNA